MSNKCKMLLCKHDPNMINVTAATNEMETYYLPFHCIGIVDTELGTLLRFDDTDCAH